MSSFSLHGRQTRNCQEFVSVSAKRPVIKVSEWALCRIQEHSTKSAMPDGKMVQRPPKQSGWMSQCVACHPVGKILFQVTASFKGPIVLVKLSVVGFLRFCKFLQTD